MEQAELAAEARGVGRLEAGGERVDCLLRLFDGSILVLCKQRQERLRQTGEVPLSDAWLVAVSVAPHVIDGAVDRLWVIDVHEGAGAVVNGLARYRHVPGKLAAPEGVEILAGNRVPKRGEPLAMAYGGHQFGTFVPQLGDGRAILLGEVIDRDGVRRDIQLKGSGPTPFSRRGDGRAALGPVLREYIVSEAMAALGIPMPDGLHHLHRERRGSGPALAPVGAGEQSQPGSLYRQQPQDRPHHGQGRRCVPALRRALPDRRVGHAEVPHRYDSRRTSMPVESINDFVVRFANINGSGSASAMSWSPASTFVAADHTSIDRMNAELHPLLLGGHFAKAFLFLARRIRIPGRTIVMVTRLVAGQRATPSR